MEGSLYAVNMAAKNREVVNARCAQGSRRSTHPKVAGASVAIVFFDQSPRDPPQVAKRIRDSGLAVSV